MAIAPYQTTNDPFGLLFDDFFGNFGRGGRTRNLMRTLDAEVVESEEDIRVLMDAPGMSPEDLEINLENNVLTIHGERRPTWSEVEERNFAWHLSERRYGKFSRSFVLPRDVEQEKIQAHFENGVLHISIPKSEQARRRKIEIQSTGNVQSGRIEATSGAGA